MTLILRDTNEAIILVMGMITKLFTTTDVKMTTQFMLSIQVQILLDNGMMSLK